MNDSISMDLISRRAVLDLPRNTTWNFYGEIVEESIDVADIERLPSAQPEIIMCRDCKYWVSHCCYEGNRILHGLFTHESDFCAWAERREDE